MDTERASVGCRIREARKAARFASARAYAKFAGFAAATYQSWEAGDRMPKLSEFQTMANDFKVNPAWLANWSCSREVPFYVEAGEQLLPPDSEMSPTVDVQDTVRFLPFSGPVTKPGLYTFGTLIRRVVFGTDGNLWVRVDNPKSENAPVPLDGMNSCVTGIVVAVIKHAPFPD